MRPSPELLTLTAHIQRAAAGLTPLASGFRHDGRQLPGADKALDQALAEVIAAGHLAQRMAVDLQPLAQ